MIDDDEARTRDLGAFRGILIALAWCAAAWTLLIAVVAIALSLLWT